jgi:hypothetical protein
MNVVRTVLVGGVVLALAACGSSGTDSTTAKTPTVPSSPASASAVPSVDAGTAGMVCAALNAMAFEGDNGADAIATAARAYHLTKAQVVYAINHRCPALKRIVPPGG